jgi:hypothetical protein
VTAKSPVAEPIVLETEWHETKDNVDGLERHLTEHDRRERPGFCRRRSTPQSQPEGPAPDR